MKNILFIAQEASGLQEVLPSIKQGTLQEGGNFFILAIGDKVKSILRKNRENFIDINDFLSYEDNLAIDRFARYCAEEWFKDPDFDDILQYRRINLGRTIVNGFDEYMSWLAKQYMVAKRLLAGKNITGVVVYAAKNSIIVKGDFNDIQDLIISEVTKDFCAEKEIAYKIISAGKIRYDKPTVSMQDIIKNIIKEIVKSHIRVLLQIFYFVKRDRSSKNILFSSSYRIVKEIMETLIRSKKYSIFYLREVFSIKQSILFSLGGVKYKIFKNKRVLLDITVKIDSLWNSFNKILEKKDTFVFDGFPLDKMMKPRLEEICKKTFPKIAARIDYFYNLLQKDKVSLIIVDEDVCVFNKSLVLVANNLGIKSIVIQHGFLGSVKEFRRAFYPLNATKIAVWGEITKDVLLAYDIPEESIAVTGCPWLSNANDVLKKNKDEIKHRLGLNVRYKTILYPDQSVLEDHLHIASTSSNARVLTEYMADIVKTVLTLSNTQLILKSHPGLHGRMMQIIQNSAELNKLLEELKRQKRAYIIDQHNIMELITISDVIIFDTTTVGFEAIHLGKPVVHYAVMPTVKEPYYFKYGAFYYATTEAQLREAVVRALEFPHERDENRRKFTEEYFYDSPGSVSRVAHLIEDMVS